MAAWGIDRSDAVVTRVLAARTPQGMRAGDLSVDLLIRATVAGGRRIASVQIDLQHRKRSSRALREVNDRITYGFLIVGYGVARLVLVDDDLRVCTRTQLFDLLGHLFEAALHTWEHFHMRLDRMRVDSLGFARAFAVELLEITKNTWKLPFVEGTLSVIVEGDLGSISGVRVVGDLGLRRHHVARFLQLRAG